MNSILGVILISSILILSTLTGCGKDMAVEDFHSFLDKHLSQIEPLEKEINLSYWRASISGKKEDFKRYAELQIKLQEIYGNKDEFEKIKEWRNGKRIIDPLDKRQLETLYRSYLRNQINPELNKKITTMATDIDNRFNVYRGEINGRTVTSNDITDILKKSKDSRLRRKAWETGKEVGSLIAEDLMKLAKLRNEAARSLGYRDFYMMSLDLNEQDEGELIALFDELERNTREPFRKVKSEMDSLLALRYGISKEDLRPWHYEDPFFQRAPQVYHLDYDGYYADKDILVIVKNFYAGIGLVVDDIIKRSNLYEKPGKEQHAYCMDVDRKGDIRVLGNIKNDENWTGTMLHELGHGVYDKYVDPTLPFLLHEAAHAFTTEAIAMFFGRLSKDANWIMKATGIGKKERDRILSVTVKSQKLSQLIFARWCQVMMRFERALYSNPDQDLNRLWWDLVEKYQMLTAPEGRNAPDWASKIHIVSVPVYYHNYMLGELLASQLNHYIHTQVIQSKESNASLNGRPEVGEYLKKNVFSAGARYRWDEMIERATGEKLTSRYFAEQFLD